MAYAQEPGHKTCINLWVLQFSYVLEVRILDEIWRHTQTVTLSTAEAEPFLIQGTFFSHRGDLNHFHWQPSRDFNLTPPGISRPHDRNTSISIFIFCVISLPRESLPSTLTPTTTWPTYSPRDFRDNDTKISPTVLGYCPAMGECWSKYGPGATLPMRRSMR